MPDPLGIRPTPIPGTIGVQPAVSVASGPSPGVPPTPQAVAGGQAAPPLQLVLGTIVTGTVIAAAPGSDAAGTRLQLRLGATGAGTVAGSVAANATATVIESAIGTLALDQHLGLPVGATIAFLRLNAMAPEFTGLPPSQTGGWPALDAALAALDKSAPALAQQLRATLAPATPTDLAGTLLFLTGTLARERWPSDAVRKALTPELRARIDDDVAALGRLSNDKTTGDWQVLTLPLLAGATVQPLHLYMQRRGSADADEPEGQRFVIEAELSRLGTLQLDGLVRGRRLDLVLRSHVPLPQELRTETAASFRSASAANGFAGEISFATVAKFEVAPFANLRRHVEVRV